MGKALVLDAAGAGRGSVEEAGGQREHVFGASDFTSLMREAQLSALKESHTSRSSSPASSSEMLFERD